MIQASGLTKRYGDRLAVDHADFTVESGTVTGFFGPNGVGKSTTMRMILGLDRPTTTAASPSTVCHITSSRHLCGRSARSSTPKAIHGGRTAYNHLVCLAESNGIPLKRSSASTTSSPSSVWNRSRRSTPAASRGAWANVSATRPAATRHAEPHRPPGSRRCRALRRWRC